MTPRRFFYHSFARGAAEGDYTRSLATLESILERGLLLVPERIDFAESLADGTVAAPWSIMQKRMSFTELEPQQLRPHSAHFGPFALEWDIKTLIEMGAIPCFYYVPRQTTPDSNDGLASAMLARLGEIHGVLKNLEVLEASFAQLRGQPLFTKITLNGTIVEQADPLTVGTVSILSRLLGSARPTNELLGALKALSGYFYPIHDLRYTEILGYYRQREWRLLANSVNRGVPVTVPVDNSDVSALLAINEPFFSRIETFPTGPKRRVEECQLYKSFRGAHVISTARRLVCPVGAIPAVEALLESKRVRLEVASLDSCSVA